ncbi:porin family protein [Martelella alba]|uniref:Porin family protein n=1 Tax=Martelella alba TaxID=2590451 RepID=A0A506UBN1_9HYPH|nr:outer membrane protein [Martelella alba]TPW30796.1 porin family protein [Martelella alba]
MKNILLSTAILMTMTGSAFAADFITPEPVYTPPPVSAPAYSGHNWTGFNIGVMGGWNWNQSKLNRSKTGDLVSKKNNNSVFGAFAGYDYQFSNNVVLGVVGDINYNPNNKTRYFSSTTFENPHFQISSAAGNGYNWEGSVRGRLGYAFDNALIYATGGWAFANNMVSTSLTVNDTTSGSKHSSFDNGWTFGAGLDYAFTNKLFARAEYRYTNFGEGTPYFGVRSKDFVSNRVMFGIGMTF